MFLSRGVEYSVVLDFKNRMSREKNIGLIFGQNYLISFSLNTYGEVKSSIK
jgi:hypothetical protein